MATAQASGTATLLCTNCEREPRAVVKKGGRKRRVKLCIGCIKDIKRSVSRPRSEPAEGSTGTPGHDLAAEQELSKLCGARKKDGTYCQADAGAGTDHRGFGRCKWHGGSTPSHVKHGIEMMARHHAVVMGAPVDIDPYAALLWTVRIAAGEVAYCNTMVATITLGKETGKPVTIKRRPLSHGKDGESSTETVEEVTEHSPSLHIWIQVRREALDRLAKFSKLAVDAGVAEREIQLAEQYGEMIGRAIGNILDGLKLTRKQQERAPELVRTHLAAIEGTTAGPAREVEHAA